MAATSRHASLSISSSAMARKSKPGIASLPTNAEMPAASDGEKRARRRLRQPMRMMERIHTISPVPITNVIHTEYMRKGTHVPREGNKTYTALL